MMGEKRVVLTLRARTSVKGGKEWGSPLQADHGLDESGLPQASATSPLRASASRGAGSSDDQRPVRPPSYGDREGYTSAPRGAGGIPRKTDDEGSERSALRGATTDRLDPAPRPQPRAVTFPPGGSSGSGTTPVVVLPEAIAGRGREKLTLPAFPTVATLRNWKLEVASILVAHSIRLDGREVGWVQESWKPGQTFEALADSVLTRFHSMGFKMPAHLTGMLRNTQAARSLYQDLLVGNIRHHKGCR
jgi:hypothetical protein